MTAQDKAGPAGLNFSFTRWVAVTPNDNADLAEMPRALYIGGAGDITMTCMGAAAPVKFDSVPLGILLVRPVRIMATGTAATEILALY
jgi:hypothetical protein